MFLSRTELCSFVGDVRPLQIEGLDEQTAVEWSADRPENIYLRTFDFANGALVALLQPGTSVVTAKAGGVCYRCTVTARPLMQADPSKPYLRCFADLHTHTSMKHRRDPFLARGEEEQPRAAIRDVLQEHILNAYGLADHAILVDDREFFRTFLQAEEALGDDPVFFPGTESEITDVETDRFGIDRKCSGEVVTLNACGYAYCRNWAEYFEQTKGNPMAFSGLAHPQVFGSPASGCPGIWNFKLKEKTTPEMLDRLRFVELGNGEERGANPINERIYSLALDCGYKVGPALNSDCHETPWGDAAMPGRTVIYAQEQSREGLLEAILAARFYCTESGDVDLWFTVNGLAPASTLPETDTYRFAAEWKSFGADRKQILLEVLSDGGETVYSEGIEGKNHTEFTLRSHTARYFYLRIYDEDGLMTWSAAVWTGRAADPCPVRYENLTPIDSTQIRVLGLPGGEKLLNGDLMDSFLAEGPVFDAVFDLGEKREIRYLGCYHPLAPYGQPIGREMPIGTQYGFVDRMAVYASDDNEHYTYIKDILSRSYGGEQIDPLEASARYLKLRINSVGSVSHRKMWENAPVQIAEITFFSDHKEEKT